MSAASYYASVFGLSVANIDVREESSVVVSAVISSGVLLVSFLLLSYPETSRVTLPLVVEFVSV